MNNAEPLEFGPEIGPEGPHRTHVDDVLSAHPPKRGRPKKYASEEERKAARRERDRARRAGKAEGGAPTATAAKAAKGDGPDLFASELAALREGYAAAPKEAPKAAPKEAPKEVPEEEPVLMGYVLLALVEALAPLAVRWIMRRDTESLALTKAERDRLEPLADRAAASLLQNADPVHLFAGAVFAVYAAKAPALPKLPPKGKASKTKRKE